MKLNMVLVDKLAFELTDKILSVNNLHKLSEVLLDHLLLVNETLLAACNALDHRCQCLYNILLLTLEILNQFKFCI